MLQLSVSITPPRFKSLQAMKRDLRGALKVFDRYYRGRVAQRFAAEGPGWAPRVEGDSDKRERDAMSLAAHRLDRKLYRQLTRAKTRLSKGKGTAATVQRRQQVYQQFYRMLAGWQGPLQKQERRLEASVGRLRERFEREARHSRGRLLGRIANGMQSKISGLVLTVINRVPFAGVLEDGGTVGHGAHLPPRPFNYFDEIDVEVFAEIVTNMIELAGA